MYEWQDDPGCLDVFVDSDWGERPVIDVPPQEDAFCLDRTA